MRARARERERERQADFLAAQVVEIAERSARARRSESAQKDGTTEERGGVVDRSRLMMDARK